MRKYLVLVLTICISFTSRSQTITANPGLTVCSPQTVVLTVNPSGASYQWEISTVSGTGPWTNTAGNSQSITVSTSGWYRVDVTGPGGGTSNVVHVVINPKPTANFTFNNNNVCSGTNVQFNGSATGGTAPYTYSWIFGGGGTSSQQNPSHAFNVTGCGSSNMNVRLIVTDSKGCADTLDRLVQVKEKPAVSIADANVFSPFSNCENSPTPSNPNYTLTINNTSANASCITTYNINWGDGNTQNGVTFPLTHTYTQLGAFNLVVTAIGSNGCTNSQSYIVANQSNPAGGIGTLGMTTGLCAPSTVPFIISNWSNNSPGTIYYIDFGDGNNVTLSHPLNATGVPDTVYHTYTASSCPQSSFTATLLAINACDTTPYTAGNIQIRSKPQAEFASNPNPGCTSASVCFTNNTIAGSFGSNCNATTVYAWDFGDPASGSNNTSSQTSPCHLFSAPGTYTVTLSATNPCGTSTITHQVCIVAPLIPAFNIDNSSGCAPLTVNVINTTNISGTCSPPTYNWVITYLSGFCGTSSAASFVSGTTATSANPIIQFNNPGTYTLQLQATNACGTFTTSKTVTVKKPPTVSITPVGNACGTVTFTPTAIVSSCTDQTLSYSWSFSGGSPSTSSNANPGNVTFTGTGSHTISLTVTNECGSATSTQSFNINPVPVLTVPANLAVCRGNLVGPLSLSSDIIGTTITWTNSNTSIGLASSGTSNPISFTANNTGSTPITATINVTGNVGGCSSQSPFTITVNPAPAAPGVSNISYCQNATAIPLTATALAGHTLLWYTSASGGTGSPTAPTPSTSSVGTTSYWVSQVNTSTNCESITRSLIQVTINSIPSIANATANNPTSCGGTNGSIVLTGLLPNTSYQISYVRNSTTVNTTITSNGTGQITITGLIAATYSNITATLAGCPSAPVGPFTLTDPTQPATPVPNANSPICSGSSINLSATSATPGVTFNWTGPNSYTGTGPTPVISAATVAASGTYFVTATLAGCSSTPASVDVLVNQTPVITSVTSNSPVCSGQTLNLTAATGFSGSTSWSWTGPNSFTASIQNPSIANATNAASGSYTAVLTNTNGNCASLPATTTVLVRPTPVINSVTPLNPAVCGGNGSLTIAGLTAGSVYTVSYTQNTSPQSSTQTANGSGEIVLNVPAGVYDNIQVSLSGCGSNVMGPFTLVNPNPPAQPVIAPFSPICAGQPLTLNANTSSGTASYSWTGPAGFTSASQNPVISPASVTNSGIYSVTATIAGCTSTAATVNVVVNATPQAPTINSNSPVCSGQSLNLNSTTAFAGPVTWQWTGPNGFTSILEDPSILSVPTAAAGAYTVIVTSSTGSCASPAATTNVIVNETPAITLSSQTNPSACATSTGSISLSGLSATTLYTVQYLYNTNPVSITASSDASGNLVIQNLSSGTYTQINVSSAGCVSNNIGPVTLSDPNPPAAPAAAPNGSICSGNTLILTASTSSPGIATYSWTGPNGFNSSQQNPSIAAISLAGTGTYLVTVQINNCVSPATAVNVLVNETPATPIASANTPLCTDSTLQLSAGTTFTQPVNWQWTGPDGFTSNQNNPVISAVNMAAAGNYTVIATSIGGNCPSASATIPVTIVQTPVISSVSSINPSLCGSSTGSISLSGLVANAVYTVHYTYNSSSTITTITANGSGTIIINNLPAGTYSNIFVTGNGCRSLAAAPVTLTDPAPPATPVASSNSAICSGQSLSLAGTTSVTGPVTFSWTGPSGFTSVLQNPSIINATSVNAGWYYVSIEQNNCRSLQDSVLVVINPLAPEPVVTSPVEYCINEPSVALTALALPSHTLNWYLTASGGTALGSAPVPSTSASGTTTYFVSQSTSFGCEGSRVPIDVVVHPDAIASFLPVDTIGCPPFVITDANVNVQLYPANNSIYNWYANGILISSGTFPGYVLTNEDDSVRISLHTISLFGCKEDSISRWFYTYKLPHPSFIKDIAEGCGPITVQFTNTTPFIGNFTYSWDFGNGQTSTLSQPAPVTFATNPTFNDTTYIIKLKVFSVCDTIVYIDSVRVKSKPKALFTPSRTIGCSPMLIQFANNSQGVNNTYYWDFDDGTTQVTTSNVSVSHTYNTGIVDTFYVKLVAVNECGSDSIVYNIIVSPNNIFVNLQVNGTQQAGCAPHDVAFINNTFGAGSFQWDFGDGNVLSTTDGIDTVYHTYLSPGTYTVTLNSANSCTDTTVIRTIQVFPKPVAQFDAAQFNVCIGQSVQFNNQSQDATSYLWQFGDGNTSVLVSPLHSYIIAGTYTVQLIAYRTNPGGTVCVDTSSQIITVTTSLPGSITISATNVPCAPAAVTFTNNNLPSSSVVWDFGDGTFGSGNFTSHTYATAGTYNVTATVIVPTGCTYNSNQVVTVGGPSGTLSYIGGYSCYPDPVRFDAVSTGATTYQWDFGDGQTQTTTTPTVFHNYANPGTYTPVLTLQNGTGCNYVIPGSQAIRVDKVDAGFKWLMDNSCGSTDVSFTDTSFIFFGTASTTWDFGDGQTATGTDVNHTYTAPGIYNVTMVVTGVSGCSKTVVTPVTVDVHNIPIVSIAADAERCANEIGTFAANINSADPINIVSWVLSNGATGTGNAFNYTFTTPGTYTLQVSVNTIYGCSANAQHTIIINPVPNTIASNDVTLCRGNSANLFASGAPSFSWTPSQGLSCTSCANPVASPDQTTPYVVTGSNQFGCSSSATVVVTVIQPFQMTTSADDSICIGQQINLLASGATNYLWSPAAGLSSTTVSNPTANPSVTTTYRVVGYDGFNCFTDTAFITVGVGQYPTVDLGPDKTYSTGTLVPLASEITNGPIRSWLWTPSTDLSCNTCPLPVATIKKNITYVVNVTTEYGCSASDTISFKTFCSDAQVFIPNAFTPDGDGINDFLRVRATGISSVKSFRIFNRWGEIVFERSNFSPNDIRYSWDGRVKGVLAPPDVFVYTAEVICDNGTSYFYKGNVSIIK